MCKSTEMRFGNYVVKPGRSQQEVQEIQANQFAIELIAPKARIAVLSNDDPSVRDVLRIASELELSKEAAARRYVELHPGKIAVVFTLNGAVRYPAKSPSCSALALQQGTRFLSPSGHQPGQISHDEIKVDLPIVAGQVRSKTAEAETFHQEGGHAFTLLNFEQTSEKPADNDDDDDGIEDTFLRFSKL
jgi:IrrE N-terminal-like domain